MGIRLLWTKVVINATVIVGVTELPFEFKQITLYSS